MTQKAFKIVFLIVLSMTLLGCVRRRMIVRSFPEGARVFIDHQEVGHTPVSVPFTYYGTREIVVEREGYQTAKARQNIRPPWYQIPPFDFFAENLWPFEIHDDRVIDFQLTAEGPVDERALQQRANQLRQSATNGFAVPFVSESEKGDDSQIR